MISFHEVHKRYFIFDRKVDALRGVSTHIQRGDLAFILGVSGSGKSTLLHLAGALDRPTSGRVEFDGRDLTTLDPTERAHLRRKRIGFVFQSGNLLPQLTALENVLVTRIPSGISATDKRRAQELLQRVGLEDRTHHRPHQLSGGEAQRVAFARAFLGHPEVVLADEPTGELDTESGQQLMTMLGELRAEEGTTVVIVTHDLSLPGPGHRILSLSDGKIISDERIAETGQNQSDEIASDRTS